MEEEKTRYFIIVRDNINFYVFELTGEVEPLEICGVLVRERGCRPTFVELDALVPLLEFTSLTINNNSINPLVFHTCIEAEKDLADYCRTFGVVVQRVCFKCLYKEKAPVTRKV